MCGADGCGGSCGGYGAGETCDNGSCRCADDRKACQGSGVPRSQCCTNSDCGGVNQVCRNDGIFGCSDGLRSCDGACRQCCTNAHCGDGTCEQGTCVRAPIRATKTTTFGLSKTMRSDAVFYPDGTSTIETFTKNTEPLSALRGHVVVLIRDGRGAEIARSQEFVCPTRCATADFTCPIPRSGTDTFFQHFSPTIPGDAQRLEILHADNRTPK